MVWADFVFDERMVVGSHSTDKKIKRYKVF